MLQDALAHHQAGRLHEAEALYRALLQAEPGNCDALHLLGVAAHQLGRHEEAAALIGKAIAADASRSEFHNNLGEVQRALGLPAEAERCYRAALALAPESAAAHGNLGQALFAQKRFDAAEQSYRRAAELDPGNAHLLVNRAAALHGLGRSGDAEQCSRAAIALQPALAEAHASLAVALAGLDRPEEAVQSGLRAVELKPDVAEVHHLLAATLAGLERFDEAAEHYRRALALQPEFTDAHVNFAQLCLMRGDYATGWQEYAWRWRRQDMARAPASAGRLWSGEEDLRGKSILVFAEQGLGDTIHFARYAPLVAARGARVLLQVPDVLAPFMRELGEVVVQGEPAPRTDFHCPLLSLPAAFRTAVESIPATIPYLRAADGGWRAKLGGEGKRLVGLCWRGNPQYAGDKSRSMRFAMLEPLLAVAGVRFVSLQKELHADEQSANLVHPGLDFRGTASLVAELDLVISVDTVWAHWAGAAGKPLWLLLSRIPHWCWLWERGDSPWYPTAKLFRQAVAGDWAPVVERVRAELGRGG